MPSKVLGTGAQPDAPGVTGELDSCSCCRNLHLAHIRMWAGDYTLSGLVGFELRCKTVGVVGTGAIGAAAARIFCVSCLCAAPRGPCAGIVAPRQSVSHEDAQLWYCQQLRCWAAVAWLHQQSEDAALPCDAVRLRAVALCAILQSLTVFPLLRTFACASDRGSPLSLMQDTPR